jgi:hypothetical protein
LLGLHFEAEEKEWRKRTYWIRKPEDSSSTTIIMTASTVEAFLSAWLEPAPAPSATVALQGFVNMNVFVGQSRAFFDFVTQLAAEADPAQRETS